MSRRELDRHLSKIDVLAEQISKHVPAQKIECQELRADLAGLLVVTIAATYESCVKETMINFALSHHVAFGDYAQNHYSRINSKIKVNDLHRYAKLFGPRVANRFIQILDDKKKSISQRLGINIVNRFELILDWRHDFAHAWVTKTTVEEAMKTHRYAKRVLYAFDKAFDV